MLSGKIFPLQEHLGEAALDCLHEGFEKGIIVRSTHALGMPTEIERVSKEHRVICANSEDDRQRSGIQQRSFEKRLAGQRYCCCLRALYLDRLVATGDPRLLIL
jgi:hypothetical protein